MPNDYYARSVPITKSDTVNFDGSTFAANAATKAIPADGVFNGGASATITVVYENGATDQFTVPTGTILPLRVIRVNSTGTAATLLCALYATP